MPKITIKIETGKVKSVDGVPVDVYLEVQDYDVEGLPDEILSQDEEALDSRWHQILVDQTQNIGYNPGREVLREGRSSRG